MKTKLFLFLCISILFSIWSCNQNKSQENIKPFSKEELKELGIVINDTGVFYKNIIVSEKKILGIYCGKDKAGGVTCFPLDSNYLKSDSIETINILSPEEVFYKEMKPTYYNFFPMTISDTLGNIGYSQDYYKHLKLFPVELDVKGIKLKEKNGIIFWFSITDSLMLKLPERFRNLKNINYKNWMLKELSVN